MPVRSPLTAYGNVRVGPPAMPLICTKFFFDCICTVKEMELEPNKPLKAEQEGAFFLAKGQEIKRSQTTASISLDFPKWTRPA
jgi:hypothetical protein